MNDVGKRVFVVDDDASVRKGLARLLRSHGFNVETFGSASDYLQRTQFGKTGCLVLDIRMPEMDGLSLQARLKEAGNDIPVVFLTGHGDIPMGVGAIKSGAVDFLTKPVDEQSLCTAVREALARHDDMSSRRCANDDLHSRQDSLTARELEVLRCILGGARNKQIGAHLGISEKTVKAHRAKIMLKMEVSSAAELGQICALAGIEPDGE